jgi:hypothetical protein
LLGADAVAAAAAAAAAAVNDDDDQRADVDAFANAVRASGVWPVRMHIYIFSWRLQTANKRAWIRFYDRLNYNSAFTKLSYAK